MNPFCGIGSAAVCTCCLWLWSLGVFHLDESIAAVGDTAVADDDDKFAAVVVVNLPVPIPVSACREVSQEYYSHFPVLGFGVPYFNTFFFKEPL